MRRLILIPLILALPVTLGAQGHEGYYRHPTIHGNTIVFVAEGDLWRTDLDGGLARRLTTHLEEETHPAIGPEGRRIAFSASYEGPSEIYVMPIDGGLPVRLTYAGEEARVVGWTPGGEILYATRKYSTLPNYQLVRLDPESGRRTPVPLAQAADGSYDRPAGTLFFTRFSKQWSHTKRYRGGTAQDIWKFAAGAGEADPLTPDNPGTSRTPMYWNGRVYFVSDRDGTLNLWSMDPDGGDLRQHTFHDGWDVLDPAQQDGRIVYRMGANIRIYDIRSHRDRPVPVRLASDLDQMRVKWVDEPLEYLSAAHIAPAGDRLVLTARGEVFVAPVERGRFVHATRRPDVRYREARFMPDGESLLLMSDESGEVEWWTLPANGLGGPEQLTRNGEALRLDGAPSPDGRWLASYDHDQELWLYNLRNGEARQIDFSAQWGFDGPTWSPDSRWVAYAKPANNRFLQIHLYRAEDGTRATITTDRFDSWSPAWGPDGKWIYFLSDRHFESLVRSPWGSRQPEPFFDRQTRLYMIALQKGLRSPFAPEDELQVTDDDRDEGKEGPEEARGEPPHVVIDLDGIERRLHRVPVEPGNYSSLTTNGRRLFWVSRETSLERTEHLLALKIESDEPEPEKLVEDIRYYELSGDGSKLLVRKGDDLYVIGADAGGDAKLDEAKVDLSGWRFPMDPNEEWRQLFVDSWRLERDYFYDPNMHGVDWEGMLEKYLPLVDRVTNRSELADLQGQMASELSALHTYVYGGDHREDDADVAPASLGASLSRDESAGGYRVDHLYRADPDYPDELSPLARPAVQVEEGDVIEAINGVATLSVVDPGALLRDQAGEQVRLRVRSPQEAASRDVVVTAISAAEERDLRYDEWEYTRRLAVDSLSGGDIGYVHLRAMGARNMAEWHRHFYPVFDRKGLIIDVRHNGGGNIDSWILARLLRTAWFYWQPRVGDPYWNMQYAFRGHMVVLIDEWTASDGEAFAEGFRRLGLGELIGTRTWGGEIWLTSSNRLADRGIVTASEFGVYGPEREWLIEGHGVEPDIVVDNLPHATFGGDDAQLSAALEHLERLIAEDPRPVPPAPPYPDKSFQRTTRAGADEDGS